MSFEAIDLRTIIRDTVREYRHQVAVDFLKALGLVAGGLIVAYLAIYIAS